MCVRGWGGLQAMFVWEGGVDSGGGGGACMCGGWGEAECVYIYVYRYVRMYVSCTVFTFSWLKKQMAHLGFSSA